MPQDNISEARANYFEKLETNKVTQAIYPHFPQGPHFINGKEPLPKNMNTLHQKCVKTYCPNVTNPQITATLSEVIENLKDTRDSVGLAIHLLHLFPFGMLDGIRVDSKHRCTSKEQIVDAILRGVLEEKGSDSSLLWVNIPNDNALKNILKEEARFHTIAALPDPLKGGNGSWANYMVMDKFDRKYNNVERVLGYYIISKRRMETKCDAMKRHFVKFQPHYILEKHCPVEISTIKRLRKACDLFKYGYRIEKLNSSKKHHLGFIRVPDGIHELVDGAISEKCGCVSLNVVIKKLMKCIETDGINQMELFRSTVTLIRHISHGNETIQCDPDRRWVFALNYDEHGTEDDESGSSSSEDADMCGTKKDGGNRAASTVRGNKLELNKENLGNTIFRSLSSLEEKLQTDFSDYENSNHVLKHVIIGFPYGCHLRSKEDPTRMCRMRFSDIPSKFCHIRGHHRMSQEIQNTLGILGNKSPCQLQSEEEWLHEQGLLHVYDTEQLMRKEKLGDLYHQLYRLHLSLKQAVTSLFELRQGTDSYYKDVIAGRKLRLRQEKDRDKIKLLKREVRQLIQEQRAFVQEEEAVAAWVLPDDVFEDHILAIERAVTRQTEVNQLFNRHGHELQRLALSKADLIGAKLVDGWKDAIDKSGGNNLACIPPEQCMQYMGDDKKIGSNMFETMVLGLAGQHVRHKSEAVNVHLQPYIDGMGDSGEESKHDLKVAASTSQTGGCTSSLDSPERRPDDDTQPQVNTCHVERCLPLGLDDRTLPPPDQRIGVQNQLTDGLISCHRSEQSDPSHIRSLCTTSRKRTLPNAQGEAYSDLIKMTKYSEKMMGNDRVLTLDEYSIMKRFCNSSTIKIDVRHFSPNDMKKFVGGTKLLPGSQIVRVGKGSDESTTTYEPIDPQTIYVDVRDFKDLLFYLICMMRRSDIPVSLHRGRIVKAFMNVLNVMFALTDSGSFRIEKCMDWVIRQNTSMYVLGKRDRERMWITFLNAITALNGNRNGEFSNFFCVRLSRHGDASMIPVKIAPEHSFSYEQEGSIADINIYQHLSAWDVPHNELDKIRKTRVDHQDFFERQGHLISKLREQYQDEITLFHEKKSGTQLVVSGERSDFDKHSKRPHLKAILPKCSEKTCPPSASSPNWEYMVTHSLFMKQHKKDMSVHRNFDMTPSHEMSENDLQSYDTEINHIRSKVCVICLDSFDNRPLEGLNCVYKELEIEFRKNKRVKDGVRLEMNADLWKDFQGYVSQTIDKKGLKGENHSHNVVEANGMHLFHRSCLRQYIQRKALDLATESIGCPICNTVIYSKDEKINILRNIDELSSRLGEYAMSDEVASYNTDDLINLKNDHTTHGGDILSRYFQSNALGDKKIIREDQNILDEMGGVVKPIEIDFLKRKDPNLASETRERYANFAINSDDQMFNPQWLARSVINSNTFETSTVQCC